jgi:hypothetical protein
VSSGFMLIGGLALHPLWLLAVIVFWSGCMSLASSPNSPWISHGLNPVCMLMSIFRDRVPFADATNKWHFSSVGGCMLVGSGV